jgi:hypothetical protein
MKYLTNQEAFNIVVHHMATQNKKSIRIVGGKETCAYRGGDGSKCAIGILIPDHCYDKKMEGKSVSNIEVKSFKYLDKRLMRELQYIHDDREISEWENCLKELAEKMGLTFPEDAFNRYMINHN